MKDGNFKDYNSIVADSLVSRLDNENNSVTDPLPEIIDGGNLPVFNHVKTNKDEFQAYNKPGWWETIKDHAIHENSIAALARAAKNTGPDWAAPNYLDQETPEDWNPYEVENLDGVPQHLWGYILESRNPRELQERRQNAHEIAAKEARMAQGDFIPTLLGATIGIATSPDSWFMPMGGIAKYASLAKHTLKGMAGMAPKMFAQSLLHESIVQTGEVGMNMETAVINAMRDTAFGLPLYGAGRAFTHGTKMVDLWSARKIINVSYEGIDAKIKAGEGGKFLGLEAIEKEGFSVGADKLNEAQKFLDSEPVMNGLTRIIGKVNKVPGIGSPLLQGMTSPLRNVRDFYARLANESIVTEGLQKGQPRPITSVEILRDITNKAKQTEFEMHDLWIQSLGLKPGVVGSTKAIVHQYKDGLSSTRSAFNDQVAEVIRTGTKSLVKEVNEAADVLSKHLDEVWERFLAAYNLPKTVLPPKTARGYLHRMYNYEELVKRPRDFINVVAADLAEQDKMITSLNQPIQQIESRLATLRAELNNPKGRPKNVVNREIRQAKKQLSTYEEDLVQKMRDGTIDGSLYEDSIWMTNQDVRELKALLAPIEAIEKRIANIESQFPTMDQNQIKQARAQIRQLKDDIEIKKSELRGNAMNGNINPRLYFKNKEGFIEFRDPNQKPKLRKIYESDLDREEAAQAYLDTLKNSTPEQINQAILNKMHGGETPDPAKARTLLVRDQAFVNNGFLSNDLSKMTQVYSRTLGKRIALKEVFNEVGLDDGIKSLSQNLFSEVEEKAALIEKNIKDSKKKEKELLKLDKQRKRGQEQISDAYNYFMGTHQTYNRVYRFDKAARNFSAITMLRNVPLLQVGELGGIVLKQGLGPFVTGGLIPLIKRVNPLIGANKSWRENATHGLVGMEIELSKFSNALFDVNAIEHIPGQVVETKLERFLDKSAKWSQRVFFTSQIQNAMQRLSASITQSRVMADIFAAQKGNISKSARQRLLINGIDPKDAAEYIKNYKAAGGHKLHGGYVSNWYLWGDKKLSSNMRRAIHNDIQGSILETGALDKPFWTRNPVVGLPFQFMGYLYAAFNKFTFPMAQSPDANKLIGLTIMVGLGSMVEPFRKFQKGEEFVIDSDRAIEQFIFDGIVESGALGYPVEFLEMVDAMLNIPFLDKFKQDKFRRRMFQGIYGGPFAGAVQNVADVATMFIDGKINERDLIKMKNITPIPINMFLDAGLNRFIKSFNLPETRKDASYYGWVDRD